MSQREGICSECHSRHPVRPQRHRTDDLCDFEEDFGTGGAVGGWVMDTHDAYGSHREGSGTMPQALVSKSPRGSGPDQAEWDAHYGQLADEGQDPYRRHSTNGEM